MDSEEAQRTTDFVDSVVSSTRSRLVLFRFPMIAFGLVSLGAAVVAVVVRPEVLGVYWAIAGTPAGIATALHYQRREDELGLVRHAAPYYATVAVLAVGVFGLPFVVRGDPGWAISIWTGLAYLAFARLERSHLVGAVAAALIALGGFFAVVSVGTEIAWVSAITGAILLVGARVLQPKELFA